MKTPSEMSGVELREAVAIEVVGVHVRKQRGERKHLRDLVIPGGVNQLDYVQEDGEPELTVHDLIKGVPAYESSIEAAFQVVEKMRDRGIMLEVTAMGWGYLIGVQVLKDNKLEFAGTFKAGSYAALPQFICRAALQAVRSAK